MGYLPELLPRMYITDMHFHHRRFNGGDRVSDSYRGMRIPSRVHNDPIVRKSDPLQFIDQLAFHIALEIGERYCRMLLLQRSVILFKSLAAIYLRLPGAQQV